MPGNPRALFDPDEKLYSTLLRSLQGIVWEADARTFQFTFVSPQAEDLLGYPVQEWLDDPQFWMKHTHPDDRGWCLDFCQSATEKRQDHQFEYRMIAADGRVVWLRDLVTFCADPEGHHRLRGILVDISASKRDKAALEERLRFEILLSDLSSEFARLPVERIEAAIDHWLRRLVELLDVDRCSFLRFDDAGHSLMRSHSYARPGLEGLPTEAIQKRFPWCVSELLQGRTLKLEAGVEPQADSLTEVEYLRKYGIQSALVLPVIIGGQVLCGLALTSLRPRPPWPEELITRLRMVGEIFGNAIGRLRDTLEQRRAEEALRTSEERFRSLVQATTQVVWHADAQGNVVDGLGWPDLTGQSFTSALGWGWMETLHPDDRERTRTAWLAAVQAGTVYETEYRARISSGDYRMLAVRGVPVRGETGVIREWVGTCTDVTAHKELQERLIQSQKMEALGRLAGGIAHDFNNTLTLFMGYTGILLESLPPNSEWLGLVQELSDAGVRAQSMTRQLLAFSRKQILQAQSLDLNSIIRETQRMLQRMIGEDVQLETRLADPLGRIMADSGQIAQVLMNLAVNARDAMPSGGHLHLETREVELDARSAQSRPGVQPGRYVLLTVRDEGQGMSQEVLRQIFEPFYTTKEFGRGTGLGLAIVYGIIRQSGGFLEVSSQPSRGTTFEIYLPLSEVQPAKRLSESNGKGHVSGTETVLLVEDDEGVRLLTRKILERRGYRVLVAATGDEALVMAQQHSGPIHLLLTDVVMPEMGGGELARRLTGARHRTKVLYMSGHPDDAVAQQILLESGAVFLQKPFLASALCKMVREVLDGGQSP